jgi:putative flippase GtrA
MIGMSFGVPPGAAVFDSAHFLVIQRQLIRYAAVGAIATAAHYALLVACVELLAWPAVVASGLGAVLGAQVAYVGNRWFTFAHQGAVAASWLKFQATALMSALLGMGMVALGLRWGFHYVAAQGVATFTTLVLSYAINRVWTFR